MVVMVAATLVIYRTWHNPLRREAIRPIATGTRIQLNHCPPEQLSLLPGIGPAMAQRIVEFREQYRRQTGEALQDPEQLLAMPGVGKLTVERIKPWLTCDP